MKKTRKEKTEKEKEDGKIHFPNENSHPELV